MRVLVTGGTGYLGSAIVRALVRQGHAPQVRIFEIVRAITGTPLPRRLPFAVASAAALIDEGRARLTGRPPLLTRATVDILRQDWPIDSARSIATLAYRMTPLEEGVRATVAAIRGFGD